MTSKCRIVLGHLVIPLLSAYQGPICLDGFSQLRTGVGAVYRRTEETVRKGGISTFSSRVVLQDSLVVNQYGALFNIPENPSRGAPDKSSIRPESSKISKWG